MGRCNIWNQQRKTTGKPGRMSRPLDEYSNWIWRGDQNQNARMNETEEEEVEDWVTEQHRPKDECYRELTPKEDAWWARHVQEIEEILRNQARQREIHGITCRHPNSVQHVMKISSCVEALMWTSKLAESRRNMTTKNNQNWRDTNCRDKEGCTRKCRGKSGFILDKHQIEFGTLDWKIAKGIMKIIPTQYKNNCPLLTGRQVRFQFFIVLQHQ